jgi:pimeloyl-ACP methyl ester carboxylesterase
MILRTETVEQVVDGELRGTFLKEVVLTPGPEPLGMVRKRLAERDETRGSVLLVHGFGQNRYTWHASKRSFSCFLAAHGWDVFNLELRGHGRSRRFGSRRPSLLDEYIEEDLPAFAREAARLSGHERTFLVGHSMGGLISYAAAATGLRDVARGVVSIGSPYRFGLGSRTLTLFGSLLTTAAFTGIFDRNPAVPLRVLGRHLVRRRALWDSRAWPAPIRPWLPGSIEPDVLEEYLRRAFDWSNIAIVLDILRAGRDGKLTSRDGRTDYGTAFEHLDRPLLVIAGTPDTLAPPESVRPAYELSRSSDKTFRAFPLGHIDLIVGKHAPLTVWPLIQTWLARR